MRACTIPGCQKERTYRLFCGMHQMRLKRYGDPLFAPSRIHFCDIPGCGRRVSTYGLCDMHARRKKAHGDPLFVNPKCNRDGHAQERNRARVKAWKQANWPAYKAYLAARKTRAKRATPLWADVGAIRAFYRACPPGFHVDHVIPLNGRSVSGLHVIENLQYLPAKENLRKGSKFTTA
jgi:hypothetical protein